VDLERDARSDARIFSSEPNLYQNEGIFADRWSMPGYAQREDGEGRSEVVDQQTGTPIQVFLPGYWNGQARMPSTQPRLPFPSLNPMQVDWGRAADRYESQNRVAQVPTAMGRELVSRAVVQSVSSTMSQPGVGRLGEFTGFESVPLWQWALMGGVLGTVLAFAWHEFGEKA
jgi:hypothetical protein